LDAEFEEGFEQCWSLLVQEARKAGVFDQQALRGALDDFIRRRREGARKERLSRAHV
jgi:hypothetical protein